jgi:hypothetical protein
MRFSMNGNRVTSTSRLWIALVPLAYVAWSAFWVGVCAFPVAEECVSATVVLYVTGFPLALLTAPMGSTILHVVIAALLGAIQWGFLAAMFFRNRAKKREAAVQ